MSCVTETDVAPTSCARHGSGRRRSRLGQWEVLTGRTWRGWTMRSTSLPFSAAQKVANDDPERRQ